MTEVRRIGLLGATGYTGRLVADELAARGLPHRLGARSAERLGAMKHGGEAETFIVDTNDPGRLAAFCDGIDAVISTVGPFVQLGMPVVEAAVEAGLPYVDSTGEHVFMTDVYDKFAAAASPVVPACGFDYLPGDLAAAVAAAQLSGPAQDIVVAYSVSGARPTRGTARSAIGIAAHSRVAPRFLSIDGPDGEASGIEFPFGEQITVPLHLPLARVRTGIILGRRPVARAVGVAAPAFRLTGPAIGLMSPVLGRLVERLPEGPTEEVRRRARYRVYAQATGRDGQVGHVLIEGSDVYRLTAQLLVEAALRVSGSGAMAPAQGLEPATFLDAVSGELLTWRTY
ncbi:MAG: NAD(P)H-binding protein [Actinomycetes bacterium]